MSGSSCVGAERFVAAEKKEKHVYVEFLVKHRNVKWNL